MSERMRKLWQHPEEHGLPACHHWTEEEIALLGTESDGAVARRLGLPQYTIENKRRRLRLPSLPRCWTRKDIALLGTAIDREVGHKLGKSGAAVRRKREHMCIHKFLARWTEEEI